MTWDLYGFGFASLLICMTLDLYDVGVCTTCELYELGFV